MNEWKTSYISNVGNIKVINTEDRMEEFEDK